jgi:hypothetical protein
MAGAGLEIVCLFFCLAIWFSMAEPARAFDNNEKDLEGQRPKADGWSEP